MTPAQPAAALVAKADEDRHVLSALRDDTATTDAIWGFHAQQAVEKLIKALLAFHGVKFPFTHRLLQLADLLGDAGHPLESRFESLLDLTPYAVEFRYSTVPLSSEPPLDRQALVTLITELRQCVAGVLKLL